MPEYFKTAAFKSFRRQLNNYGFRMIFDEIDKGSYFHELFIRNQKEN